MVTSSGLELTKLQEEAKKLRAERDAQAARADEAEEARDAATREQAKLRTRLWWQRARLKVSLKKKRNDLAEMWVDLDSAREEAERDKQEAQEKFDEVKAKLDKRSAALFDANAKNEVLTEALGKQSDAVSALKRRQADLLLSTREATLKTRTLEHHLDTHEAHRHEAGSKISAMKEEMQTARWEANEARRIEGELRNALYDEELRHAASRDALEAVASGRAVPPSAATVPRGSEVGEDVFMSSHEQRVARLPSEHYARDMQQQLSQASLFANGALSLAEERLIEAASARAERATLEARVRNLEREVKLSTRREQHMAASASVPIFGAPSAARAALMTPPAFGGSAGKWGARPRHAIALPVAALNQTLRDLATGASSPAAASPHLASWSRTLESARGRRPAAGVPISPPKRLLALGKRVDSETVSPLAQKSSAFRNLEQATNHAYPAGLVEPVLGFVRPQPRF